MKNFKAAALFFGMLFVSCASTRNITVPEDVQKSVEQRIKNRDYTINFTRPYESTEDNNPHKPSVLWWGNISIQGDTVKFCFQHPAFEEEEIFRMQDYCQSKTQLGETVITFFVMRYNKKQEKNIQVPFYFKIYSLSKIDVSVDGDSYKGAFNDKSIQY